MMTEPTPMAPKMVITKSFGPCRRCMKQGYERVGTAPYVYFGAALISSICPHCDSEIKNERRAAKRHREYLENTGQIPKERGRA